MKLNLLEITILMFILAIGLSIYDCAGRFIESQPERVMFQDYPDIAVDMTGVWDQNKSNNQLKRKNFKPGSTREWV